MNGQGGKDLKTANWQSLRYTRINSLHISHTAHCMIADFLGQNKSKKRRNLHRKGLDMQMLKKREQFETFPQNWTHDKLASAITMGCGPVTAGPIRGRLGLFVQYM